MAHDPKHDSNNPLVRWQAHRQEQVRSIFKGQFWLILKNVLGWVMILTTPAIGFLPGPGGIIWFVIGFALATIPGKRRITTRMMRGKPVAVGPGGVIVLATILTIIATVGLLWLAREHSDAIVKELQISDDESERVGLLIFGLAIAALPLSWLAVRLSVWGVNLFIRTLPLGRRYIRPWLRKRGIVFLPSRRQRAGDVIHTRDENEIIEISESNQKRISNAANWGYRWARRAAFTGLTIWIFWAMIKPIYVNWDSTRERLAKIDFGDVAISVVMWAIFLGAVRAMSWREILRGFGFSIPRLAALRIWSSSELARYIPGVIWQVVGRVRLVKPYGVRGSVCTSSQIFELAIFVMANLIVAIGGLCWVGYAKVQGPARTWLLAALAATPLLAIALHPAIFYNITNRILVAIRKPPLESRLSVARSFGLLMYAVLGLLWQSLAMWLLLREPLELDASGIGLIAGAYCLAWTAGFVAFWAPAGAGVREAVLIGTLGFALPASIKAHYGDASILEAVVILVRLWTVAAELLLVAFANSVDFRGAINMFSPVPIEKSTKHVTS